MDELREKIARRVGENLRRAREGAGQTQKGLARMGFVTQSLQSAYETGAKLPQLDTLVYQARLFGVTLFELLEGVEEMAPKEQDKPTGV